METHYEVFEFLQTQLNIDTLFSHNESGIEKSWIRDKSISKFCEKNKITWHESQQNGVVRGLKNRANWAKLWNSFMAMPLIQNKYNKAPKIDVSHPFQLPKTLQKQLDHYPEYYQPAGEYMAWRYLDSFLMERGFNYQKYISKPTESRVSCSRISPFLSWGNLSVRQVFQYVNMHPNAQKENVYFRLCLQDCIGIAILFKSLKWSVAMKHNASMLVMNC